MLLILSLGGSYSSIVFTRKVCGQDPNCIAKDAGLYFRAGSKTKDDSSNLTFNDATAIWGSHRSLNLTSEGTLLLDTFSFSPENQTAEDVSLEKIAFYATDSQIARTPTDQTYQLSVGALALGVLAENLTVPYRNGSGSVAANSITPLLKKNYGVPSNSWGLHVGSAQHKLPGSLIIGGYDQSRALGDVLVGDLGDAPDPDPLVKLVDVHIGVEDSGAPSPFNTTMTPSLFSSKEGSSVTVVLNHAPPYMSLPPWLCQGIASWLPVTFLPRLGLYTWNVDDPRYDEIISSSAQLEFTFGASLTKNVTIKVPFSLLNLTLEFPLADTPTPYFPCSPRVNENKNKIWSLGRAFLQSAYFGYNWDSKKLFVAQAPGPGAGPARIQPFEESATDMTTDPVASYASSWQDTWKQAALSDDGGSQSDTSESSPNNGNGGIGGGAIAGIVVGCVAVVLGLVLLAVFAYHRRRRQQDFTPELDASGVNRGVPGVSEKRPVEESNNGQKRTELEAG